MWEGFIYASVYIIFSSKHSLTLISLIIYIHLTGLPQCSFTHCWMIQLYFWVCLYKIFHIGKVPFSLATVSTWLHVPLLETGLCPEMVWCLSQKKKKTQRKVPMKRELLLQNRFLQPKSVQQIKLLSEKRMTPSPLSDTPPLPIEAQVC